MPGKKEHFPFERMFIPKTINSTTKTGGVALNLSQLTGTCIQLIKSLKNAMFLYVNVALSSIRDLVGLVHLRMEL